MSRKDTLRSNREKKNVTSRRSLLKIGAAAASVAAAPGIVGATSGGRPSNSERADRIHSKALKIRERTGSQERFKEYLSNHADHFQSHQQSFQVGSDDGVSSQEWRSTAFDNDLMLTYYDSCASGDPYAYFDYYITIDSGEGWGEGGPDQISLGWADHHYRYEEGSAYYDSDMDNMSLKKESLNGVDWEWKDGKSCYNYCGTKDFYVGCKAQLLTTDQERAVEANYWDMYDRATVDSVSFSSSGDISFTFSTTGNQDQHAYKIEEDSDAYSGCAP